MEIKKLWGNKWMEILEYNGWYTAAHNTRGDGVCVVGYDDKKEKILVRIEHTPPHGDGLRRTSLTGTIEGGLDALDTAVKELKEESGYEAHPSEFYYLGWVFPSKFSDYKLHLFAVNLAGKTPGEIKGDGTKGEEQATVEWMSPEDVVRNVDDPSILATLMRLAVK